MVGFETSGSATIQLISLAEFDYIFHIQLLQIIQPVETGPARIGMEWQNFFGKWSSAERLAPRFCSQRITYF